MSIPVQTPPTPAAVFQSHFGTLPGTSDLKSECERWERLCAELLAEREKLVAERDRARLELVCAEWGPIGSMEEVYAQVDRSITIQELVAEMERELEAEK